MAGTHELDSLLQVAAQHHFARAHSTLQVPVDVQWPGLLSVAVHTSVELEGTQASLTASQAKHGPLQLVVSQVTFEEKTENNTNCSARYWHRNLLC